ncbi:hypothetical protein BKA62DRAFT_420639 [Auriculariales sp. MPI-PUGE-AT-0066]|nr:hypothetical protein BKA62DRAFT_420639 [Auriculariales sp. MPI-PUGE-AT-0066]
MCWNLITYACGHVNQSFSLTCKCQTRCNDMSASIRCRPACCGPTASERAEMTAVVS